MAKYYKQNWLVKFFTVAGGFIGLMYCFFGILDVDISYKSFSSLMTQLFSISGFFGYVLGMVIAVLTMLVASSPNDPIPWHWSVLISFSILLMLFSHLIAGFSVLAAGFIKIKKKR